MAPSVSGSASRRAWSSGWIDLRPELGVGVPRLGRVAEHRLALRADVDGRPVLDGVDVHDDGDLLDEGPVPLLGLRALGLRALAVGDVEHHALPGDGVPVRVPDHHGPVGEPAHPAVARDHPVLGLERLAGLLDPPVLGGHALTVLRVDRREPHGRVTHPLLAADAQQVLDALVDEDQGEPVAGEVLGVDDRGQLVDERAVAGLGLAHPLLAVVLGGDVEHDPLPVQGGAVGLADQGRFVADPPHLAVARVHAVLGPELAAGAFDAFVDLADARAVVGVELARPRERVGHPLARREAEDGLDLRAHVQHRARQILVVLGGLEVDDRRQVLDHAAEPVLGLDRARLQGLAVGDLHHEPADQHRDARHVAHGVPQVTEPHVGPVARAEPVLLVEPAALARDADEPLQHALAILGMQAVGPEVGVGEPLGRAPAQELLGALGDERERQARGVGLPDDAVEVGDQAPHPPELGAGRGHGRMRHAASLSAGGTRGYHPMA